MTQLRLKLHQPMVEGQLEAGAVAAVRWLADATGALVKKWWRVEKPVDIAGESGDTGEYTVFDLPGGGYYSVDIIRPRGPDISREYQVDDGAVLEETLKMEVSPHEYLGWQQFAGIVRATPYTPETEAMVLPSALETRRDRLMAKGWQRMEALYAKRRDVPSVFSPKLPNAAKAWSLISRATRGEAGAWVTEGDPLDWSAASEDEFVTWFREMPDIKEAMLLIERLREDFPLPRPVAEKYPRWIVVDSEGQMDLVSVPWAWWRERGPAEEIRLLYDRVRSSPIDWTAPGRMVVSVHDTRWFSLLEFLASGRIWQAGSIADAVFERETPETALYGKVKGPLVAVAGGIVLVARAAKTGEQNWDRWLENLCNWFPGVPDGAILFGSRRLQQAQSHKDMKEAYALLKKGYRRGIPFFSATIHILSVALAQIGGEIEEADVLRQRIGAVAARVDPDQPFTVIRL